MLRLSLGLAGLLILAPPAFADFPSGGAADLRTQTNVEVIGAQAGTFAASTVAPAGDFNGDGADDVLVAAPSETTKAGALSGAVYVLFGGRKGAPRRGPAGIRIAGPSRRDELGRSAAAAGDFDGDGIDDIVIGAPRLRRSGDAAPRGAVHVVFGSRRPRTVRLDALGRDGLTLYGARAGVRLGADVAGGRDVDGDGRPDVVVGTGPRADDHVPGPVPDAPAGSVLVVRGGRRHGTIRRADLTLRGVHSADVGLVGDMNGDGRAEILTGGGAPTGKPRTLARVVFGRPARGGEVVSAPGFDITGDTGIFVSAVADAGDVDGDGRGDVVVSTTNSRYAPGPGNMAFQGGITIVHGKATGEAVDAHAPGGLGLALTTPGLAGQLGAALGPAGDLDGDGLDDVVAGAPTLGMRGREGAGSAYVVFGSRATGTAAFATARTSRFDGEQRRDRLGHSVAGAGDFNDDGKRDLVFGSPNASREDRVRNGAAYLVYGR